MAQLYTAIASTLHPRHSISCDAPSSPLGEEGAVISRSRCAWLDAHERADALVPLGGEGRVGPGLQAHRFAAEVFPAEEIPGA